MLVNILLTLVVGVFVAVESGYHGIGFRKSHVPVFPIHARPYFPPPPLNHHIPIKPLIPSHKVVPHVPIPSHKVIPHIPIKADLGHKVVHKMPLGAIHPILPRKSFPFGHKLGAFRKPHFSPYPVKPFGMKGGLGHRYYG